LFLPRGRNNALFKKNFLYPLSTVGEERVGQRSVAGMSKHANALTPISARILTHPTYASLGHLLYGKP